MEIKPRTAGHKSIVIRVWTLFKMSFSQRDLSPLNCDSSRLGRRKRLQYYVIVSGKINNIDVGGTITQMVFRTEFSDFLQQRLQINISSML